MTSDFEVETPPQELGLAEVRGPADISEAELGRMRDEYGYVRTFFKTRPERFQGLQRALNQARIGATYDEYLATTVVYAALATLVGVLLGVLLTWQLDQVGVVDGLSNPLASTGPVVQLVAANKTLFAGLALTVVSAGTFGAAVWYARYYYPQVLVSSRRQNIDVVLPHAIVYMYALSHGGLSLYEVMRSLANAPDTYGEVANEFEMIVNDIDRFGSDTYTALQNARNLTPSENFEQFLDDLVAVLDSGGELARFLEEESETYLREAEDQQESFIETLALLAEIFVVGFVAAPLFFIVTLVVISLMGGSTISTISLLVYGVMPLAMLGFVLLVDALGQPYEQVRTTSLDRLDRGDDPEVDTAPLEADERFTDYRTHNRLLRVKELVRNPVPAILLRPVLTLAVSVPVALAVLAAFVTTGNASLSTAAIVEEPVATTTALFVVPFLVVAVPLAVVWELERHREREVARRFPDTLNILSSANNMGIPLVEALDLVSRWSTGAIAREVRTVYNDIRWNHDTTAALLDFGRRLKVPQLSRTMKLLADGMRASGDLGRVLSIAAEDTRNRDKLDRARRRELSSYIAVVIIGFLVYLVVLVMLDTSFLDPITQVGGDAGAATDVDGQELPVSFIDVPVDTYHAIFYHSALIQAIGSGLLAGKLTDNEALSGLKYAVGLVLLTVVAFALI